MLKAALAFVVSAALGACAPFDRDIDREIGTLVNLVTLVGDYHREKGNWPGSTTDLSAFAISRERPFYLSRFRRLEFHQVQGGSLKVVWETNPKGSWIQSGGEMIMDGGEQRKVLVRPLTGHREGRSKPDP